VNGGALSLSRSGSQWRGWWRSRETLRGSERERLRRRLRRVWWCSTQRRNAPLARDIAFAPFARRSLSLCRCSCRPQEPTNTPAYGASLCFCFFVCFPSRPRCCCCCSRLLARLAALAPALLFLWSCWCRRGARGGGGARRGSLGCCWWFSLSEVFVFGASCVVVVVALWCCEWEAIPVARLTRPSSKNGSVNSLRYAPIPSPIPS